jgi:large subunit ribosomal protein L16
MIAHFCAEKTKDNMLSPKRTKYRKQQKGKLGNICPNTTRLQFGKYGVKSLASGRIKAKTIEAVRRVITRKLKRGGQVWIRVYPDIAVTAKPLEVRMGKGKGAASYWICRVKAGQILYEIDGVSLSLAKQAALLAYYKLPIKTTFSVVD